MLLTLKNKMCLGMDALIKEAIESGGHPAVFKLTTQEAVSLLKEITKMNPTDRSSIVITQKNENETDTRFLLKSPLTEEMAKFLLNRWNKKEINVFYKNIEVIIFNKSPAPPPSPPLKIIKNGGVREKCVICGSSMKRKWFFWIGDGCIQPECKNYYEVNTGNTG